MTPEALYEFLLNTLQPNYEKKFGVERKKNVMNVSSLVQGPRHYLYWYKRPQVKNMKLAMALFRGSAVHAYLSERLNDADKHLLIWKIPYQWKSGETEIVLVAHYDNLVENALLEFKTTSQDDIYKNSLVDRAKRQCGTYCTILSRMKGVSYEAFVCVFNNELNIIKLTPEEILAGFEYVRTTALEVAKVLNQ